MSVAVPAPQSAGQDGQLVAPATVATETPKIPQAESNGEQSGSRDQGRQPPKDYVSDHLQLMARLAEHQAIKELRSRESSAAETSSTSSQTSSRADVSTSSGGTSRSGLFSPGPLHAGSLPYPPPEETDDSLSEQADGSFAQDYENAQERRVTMLSPADLEALPDILDRFDSNGDGQINQAEMKQFYRANDQSSTYEGLGEQAHHHTTEDSVWAVPADQSDEQSWVVEKQSDDVWVPPNAKSVEAEALSLTDAERRALSRADEVDSQTTTSEAFIPRKLYDTAEEVDSHDATQTYQQVNDGPGDKTSFIA